MEPANIINLTGLLLQMQGHCIVFPSLPSTDGILFPFISPSTPKHCSSTSQFVPPKGRLNKQCKHLPSISQCPFTIIKKGPGPTPLYEWCNASWKDWIHAVFWKGSRCCNRLQRREQMLHTSRTQMLLPCCSRAVKLLCVVMLHLWNPSKGPSVLLCKVCISLTALAEP